MDGCAGARMQERPEMVFDYGSVLVAVGATGIALCITLFANWLRQRGSGFLMTWSIGMGLIVVSVASFAAFIMQTHPGFAIGASILLTSGISVSYGGMVQFTAGKFPARTVAAIAITASAPPVAAFLFGYDGLGFVLLNLVVGILLCVLGVFYWRGRAEFPVPIAIIAGLHVAVATTFLLCAAVAALETPLHLVDGPPQNWAEVLNLVTAVIALSGVGGLLVTIHQERISRRHRYASLTDPLTELSNRRALFERFEDGTVPEGTAFIILDLDNFKLLNDGYGHAFGDEVLRGISLQLRAESREGDMAVRLGGEEFLLVLDDMTEDDAVGLAERVRAGVAGVAHGPQQVVCTLSAGVAVAHREGISLDTLLRKADNALYLSKRNGRNKVSVLPQRAA